jgi:hypothetical protein
MMDEVELYRYLLMSAIAAGSRWQRTSLQFVRAIIPGTTASVKLSNMRNAAIVAGRHYGVLDATTLAKSHAGGFIRSISRWRQWHT